MNRWLTVYESGLEYVWAAYRMCRCLTICTGGLWLRICAGSSHYGQGIYKVVICSQPNVYSLFASM
jgi:hypothetical protein